MRGVFVVTIVFLLLLTSCEFSHTEFEPTTTEFNRVYVIDYPYEDPDSKELESLYAAYKNENKALSLYRKTLDLFPSQEPFESVMLFQEFQISFLEEAYTKYELHIPQENWYPNATKFSTIEEACASSLVFAEQSIDLYEKWLDHQGFNYNVDNQDLRFLYEKILDNYQNRLIPSFKRCGRGLR